MLLSNMYKGGNQKHKPVNDNIKKE